MAHDPPSSPPSLSKLLIGQLATNYRSLYFDPLDIFKKKTGIDSPFSPISQTVSDQTFIFENEKEHNKYNMHKIEFHIIPQMVVNLLDPQLRDDSLKMITTFLTQRRDGDPYNYARTGFLLFHSWPILALIRQELVIYRDVLLDGRMSCTHSDRLADVVKILWSIAAHPDLRMPLVQYGFATALVSVTKYVKDNGVVKNLRAMCLFLVYQLCKYKEREIFEWAFQNKIIVLCQESILVGNWSTVRISADILELLLCHTEPHCLVCDPSFDGELASSLVFFNDAASKINRTSKISPILIFGLIRCYLRLDTHPKRQDVIAANIPSLLLDRSFLETIKAHPNLGSNEINSIQLRERQILAIQRMNKRPRKCLRS